MRAYKPSFVTAFWYDERGNALFLILIAIMVFAGLSYAVTQNGVPSRSARLENEIIASSQLTQYGNALRLSMDRMQIAGFDTSEILFETQTSAAEYTDERNIFNPKGFAGLRPLLPMAEAFTTPVEQQSTAWVYRTNSAQGNGQTLLPGTGSAEGIDRIVVLSNLSQNVCRFINQRLGVAALDKAIPPVGKTAAEFTNAAQDLDLRGEAYIPAAQPFLCVRTTDNKYVYMHVLSDS